MQAFVIKGKASEIKSKIVECVKESLYKSINENGRTSDIVVKESQELDKLIAAEMGGYRI